VENVLLVVGVSLLGIAVVVIISVVSSVASGDDVVDCSEDVMSLISSMATASSMSVPQ
jgi:hypothetical protein